MLTSKKDEIQQRLNSILQRLSGITFVPSNWNEVLFWDTLEEVGLSQNEILCENELNLFNRLVIDGWSWDQLENLADILVELSIKNSNTDLKQRAKKLYQFILNESKMFSFQIITKINNIN